ncbi:MAG: hypothetical protein PVH77_03870 [Phycisphaerales bacterium]|jgi:hypothetical protein
MKIKKLLFYLLAAMLGGCIPVMSLHSLHTEKDVMFDAKLLGTWTENPEKPEATWEFTRMDKPKNAYNLLITENEEEKGLFVAYLVKLQDQLFLDLSPVLVESDDPNEGKLLFNDMFLIPAHTFIKVDSIEPQLKFRLTQDNKTKELLKTDPNAVKHTIIEDRLVLTASTKDLQSFVLKYANDNRLFADETILSRVKTTDPNTPEAAKPQR